jgi:phosphatidyl-myo-inositol dimannoside synthase
MKTLLLAPEMFSSEGGIPRILRLYLKALCELSGPNDEVRLVTLNDVQIDSRELRTYASDRLVSWNACGRDKLRFVRGAIAEAPNVDRIVCGHVAQLPAAWLCKKKNRRLKYVFIAHGFEVWRRFNLTERIALKGAHQAWCVSEYTRQQLLENSRLAEQKTLVLPNALDPTFVDEAPQSRGGAEPIILTIARLSAADSYKGIDHLIDALPEIRRRVPHATLRVIGRGDDLPRLQQLAASAGVAESVRFLGYIGDKEMKAELKQCRIFALPSEREGFGLVYLEAMAYGKPCVGADAGGTPEVLSPDSGLLCPYGNVEALAAACAQALQTSWNPDAIRARAAAFSYPVFKDRLKALLTP